jgi:hypothetical protein
MTRDVDTRVEHNTEHGRHGSAVVALRRLTHRERDGRVVVEDDPIWWRVTQSRGKVKERRDGASCPGRPSSGYLARKQGLDNRRCLVVY